MDRFVPLLSLWLLYEYREQYGLNKGVHRCPADRTALGGSYDKQGWSWQQLPSQPIYDDSDFYSSYYPNSVILLGERPLSQVAAPDLTFLLLETSIPNATWRPNNGPDYFASIHDRGRNYHLGENNCYKGISAFVDGHAELWD